MNIDAPFTDQAGSNPNGMSESAIAREDPRPDEILRWHRIALVILQSPAIPPRVLQWLMAMPTQTLKWIWNGAPESDPLDPAEAFAKACTLLSTMPIESAQLTCEDVVDRLGRLLMAVHSWRLVPPGLLAKMLLMLPRSGPPDRLLHLQLQHVAQWGSTKNRRMLSAPRRDWAVFVGAAMKWRHHDEIALRTRPHSWAHPLPNLRVNGFEMIPVCGTGHLVEAQGHQGALCSSKVADACQRGAEAWWFVRSGLGVPFPANFLPVDAAVSLLANEDGWSVGPVLAPPHCMQAAMRVVSSLAVQAEVELRLQQTSRMALPGANDLPGTVHEALVALLQQSGASQSSRAP